MVAATDDPAATLHGPWFGQPSWCILDLAGDQRADRFLGVWQAWREARNGPLLLHYVLVTQDAQALLQSIVNARLEPRDRSLGLLLREAAYGLTLGQHRLSFEEGRVMLTLALGSQATVLRQLQLQADQVLWVAGEGDSSIQVNNVHQLKSLTRLCRRGAALSLFRSQRNRRAAADAEAFTPAFKQCGLVPAANPGNSSATVELIFAPPWRRKARVALNLPLDDAGATFSCVVIGAGLAGAAAAASLARRGWSVQVLDGAPAPACAASGLPVGLLAPHFSADDNLFSRLTRAGARMTWQELGRRQQRDMQRGLDWDMPGVLELGPHAALSKPKVEHSGMSDWDRPASKEQLRLAGLPANTLARWHGYAGWIKPAALVQALLSTAGVNFRGHAWVGALTRVGDRWEVLGMGGERLATSSVLVLAAGAGSDALLGSSLGLQPVPGQISWSEATGALPPFPVHGNGSLIPGVPTRGGSAWYLGASYHRGLRASASAAEDHRENLARLASILPAAAAALAPCFDSGRVKAWSAIRATTRDRLPIVGRIESGPHSGIWLSTGMGSRGLSFALLCGELLAAQINGEPWPIERKTALALAPARLAKPPA